MKVNVMYARIEGSRANHLEHEIFILSTAEQYRVTISYQVVMANGFSKVVT